MIFIDINGHIISGLKYDTTRKDYYIQPILFSYKSKDKFIFILLKELQLYFRIVRINKEHCLQNWILDIIQVVAIFLLPPDKDECLLLYGKKLDFE